MIPGSAGFDLHPRTKTHSLAAKGGGAEALDELAGRIGRGRGRDENGASSVTAASFAVNLGELVRRVLHRGHKPTVRWLFAGLVLIEAKVGGSGESFGVIDARAGFRGH